MIIHFSILVWKIPWTDEPDTAHGVAELDITEQLRVSLYFPVPHLDLWEERGD